MRCARCARSSTRVNADRSAGREKPRGARLRATPWRRNLERTTVPAGACARVVNSRAPTSGQGLSGKCQAPPITLMSLPRPQAVAARQLPFRPQADATSAAGAANDGSRLTTMVGGSPSTAFRLKDTLRPITTGFAHGSSSKAQIGFQSPRASCSTTDDVVSATAMIRVTAGPMRFAHGRSHRHCSP